MFKTLRAANFLIKGPLILLLLVFINWVIILIMPEQIWWVQWAALGIGIAWLVSLYRVLKGIVMAGGLAALFAFLKKSKH